MGEIKTVLVTGNNGYVGSVLTQILSDKGYSVVGFDTDFYEGVDEITLNFRQITKDLRDISIEDLEGIDAVIHLAALSNDPLGELNKDLTRDINFVSTVKLGQIFERARLRNNRNGEILGGTKAVPEAIIAFIP